MQLQTRSKPAAAIPAAYPDAPLLTIEQFAAKHPDINVAELQGLLLSTTPRYYTVEQFANRQPAFTEAALRNMIFKAESRHGSKGKIPGNGLIECGAIVRVGRKVLIDEARFLDWIRTQSAKG